MNIVVLDGQTVTGGDLDWRLFEELGTCRIYPRTSAEEVPDRSRDADVILTNKARLTAGQLKRLQRLRYIGVLATGYDVVDTVVARRLGITVTNVPGYATRSVAQATFALLVELTNAVGRHAETVRQGRWTRCPDFCYWDRPIVELDGLTMGLVGFGATSQAVAGVARAFGMRVLAHTLPEPRHADGTSLVDMETLLSDSDVVSLHCPLTPQTAGLMNAERLGRMKRTALLLNTARGRLIDEPALAGALNDERIAGAGLDVLTVEPPTDGNPLLHAKNCLITPHQAWASAASRRRLLTEAAKNLQAFMAGNSRNVVN